MSRVTPADGTAEPHGLFLWVVVFSGIALWTVHVFAEISLVRASVHHPGIVWVMHGLTVGLALAASAATAWCLRLAHEDPAPDGDHSAAGRRSFLGWFGVVVNGFNTILIVLEGVYVALLPGHG